jgi:hypothetical protein
MRRLGCDSWITSAPVSCSPRASIVSGYSLNDHPSVRSGTRGATSAEYFLKAGYAVIFMHRQFSLQPFSRHYSHSTNPFLDFLDIESDPDKSRDTPKITATPSKNDDLLEVLMAYKSVQQAGLLHTLTFVTVNDYLWLLRAVSQELSTLGRNALYYLAAAVSDFFLPRRKLVRQSSLSIDQLLCLWDLLVRAQDSIWERQLVD